VTIFPDRSPPNPQLLERLNVYDGLMMNAKRWFLSEQYQRQRQGYLSQAISEPGIVFGLGVHLVQADEALESEFKTGQWIEIQPGFAIDREGNPIVVDMATDRKYLIDVSFSDPDGETIYVVILHQAPHQPAPQEKKDTLREWFQLEQLRQPPTDGKRIELCRIRLQRQTAADSQVLKEPEDVFHPGVNQLDLRFRRPAHLRPQFEAKVAQLYLPSLPPAKQGLENLTMLSQSLVGLYPAIAIKTEPQPLPIKENMTSYAMLFINDGDQLLQTNADTLEILKQYLSQGGGILIEVPNPDSDLVSIQQKLKDLDENGNLAFTPWEKTAREHPLRQSPFLFGALPALPDQNIQVYVSSSIVLIQGQISPAWGLTQLQLSRSTIRDAQEFGINLLNFFGQRWQMRQLMQQQGASHG
jgi:hypothetical protein